MRDQEQRAEEDHREEMDQDRTATESGKSNTGIGQKRFTGFKMQRVQFIFKHILCEATKWAKSSAKF